VPDLGSSAAIVFAVMVAFVIVGFARALFK
jgi:hypothetical protein